MGIVEAAGLVAAAFAASAVNAVAGGGSLISFPVLLAAGWPPKVANVTNTVGLWPGTVSGSVNYRAELSRQPRRLAALAAPSVSGALVGAVILLATPESVFDVLVPFLILLACLLLAAQDRLLAWASARGLAARGENHLPLALHLATFVVAIYGAYFGAGLGILILAFLGILLPDDLQHSNALKGVLSLLVNAVGAITFILFGPVAWNAAALMAVGSIAGGYLGVGVARRLGRTWLRRIVIAVGLVAATVLLLGLQP
jgi:hypothetical protein